MSEEFALLGEFASDNETGGWDEAKRRDVKDQGLRRAPTPMPAPT